MKSRVCCFSVALGLLLLAGVSQVQAGSCGCDPAPACCQPKCCRVSLCDRLHAMRCCKPKCCRQSRCCNSGNSCCAAVAPSCGCGA